jgi:hypothetical protein
LATGLNSLTSIVRMAVECQQLGIVRRGADVVEQQTHPHAAVGCIEQTVRQHLAGGVAVPDVILHVEAFLGEFGQAEACQEGVGAPFEQQHGRHVGASGKEVAGGLTELRVGGIAQRGRRRALDVGRQAGTACLQQGCQQNQPGKSAWCSHFFVSPLTRSITCLRACRDSMINR